MCWNELKNWEIDSTFLHIVAAENFERYYNNQYENQVLSESLNERLKKLLCLPWYNNGQSCTNCTIANQINWKKLN